MNGSDATSATSTTSATTGERLSFTKLSTYEQCPTKYAFRYRERLPQVRGGAASLGRAVHRTLEALVCEAMVVGGAVPLSATRGQELFREMFVAEGVDGVAAFEDGWRMVGGFVDDQRSIVADEVLGIERAFSLPLGRFVVEGVMDRVDRTGPTSIKIIDFKTNQALYREDELATNLQMSLYAAAAKDRWPWVEQIELVLWNLRHRVQQRTTRTTAQLDAALAYALALGEQLSTAAVFPARLGPLCGFCDHRAMCADYQAALAGDLPAPVDGLNLDALMTERMKVAGVAKVAEQRRVQIDKVLRTAVHAGGTQVLAGHEVREIPTISRRYPVDETVALIADVTDVPVEKVRARLVVVDNDRLASALAEVGAEHGRVVQATLRAELEARAEVRRSPRLIITPVKAGANK